MTEPEWGVHFVETRRGIVPFVVPIADIQLVAGYRSVRLVDNVWAPVSDFQTHDYDDSVHDLRPQIFATREEAQAHHDLVLSTLHEEREMLV